MTVAFDDKTIEQHRLGKVTVQKATITETGKTYISLRPGYNTMITLNKDTSEGTLKMTNDYTRGGSVDAAEFGAAISEGAANFQKGETAGFTGLEVDITTYNNDVELIVSQFLIGD